VLTIPAAALISGAALWVFDTAGWR
jgi:hypothetical protein